MNVGEGAETIWYLLAMVLVGSALLSRRLTFGRLFIMVFGWVAVFAAMLFIYSKRHDLISVTQQTAQKGGLLSDQKTEGSALHIDMASDGHFWVNAMVNGTEARFLIDSGATISVVSEQLAMKAGLNVDSAGPGVAMQTANGTVIARRSNIAGLTIGPISTNDLPVVVSGNFGNINVLGMNFLSRLKSWRVERGQMVLEP